VDLWVAAQAKTNDWGAAVRNAQVLLAHPQGVGEREWSTALEARLALYPSGQPLRRPAAP
jgi:hypothetical protein